MLTRYILVSMLAVGFISLGFISCGDHSDNIENMKAIGGVKYGGTFRMMSSEKIQFLSPLQATDIYNQRVTCQLFDPLLKLDASGNKVIPALAESYTISNDGKTYTLNIRKGVYFHPDACLDNEGRELTADDVKYSLDMSCSQLPINEISFMLVNKVKGAEAFYKSTKKSFKSGGVAGIKVTGRYSLKIELNEAFAGFDKMLTYSGFSVFPKEAFEMYGSDLAKHPVGTGPFMLEESNNQHILLKRNPKYWAKDNFGNQLPYLAGIEVLYAENKRSELIAFRKKEIDLVLEIPTEEVENILGSLQEAQEGKTVKHKIDSKQSFSLTYMGIQHSKAALQSVDVRRALNLAVDREYIVNNILDGEGYAVKNGIIPNTDYFDASKVKAPAVNPVLAKSLLAKAGYPDGKGFPELTIVVAGKKNAEHHKLALGVARQLKENLNISVKVDLVDLETRNRLVKNRQADLWIAGWIADYPDPESFLSLFYGKYTALKSDFLNPFEYKNAKYDALFEKLNKEQSSEKRTQMMIECDQILVNDAVVIPLTNGDFITMINSRIRNFETNSLETLDFSSIFIKEPKGSE